jgi:hypothetical protein
MDNNNVTCIAKVRNTKAHDGKIKHLYIKTKPGG